MSKNQLELADDSIKRIKLSLNLLAKTMKSLDVRAPISGHLSSLNAEIGQSIGAGQSIGQIDGNKFKIDVQVDQYYISKVVVGTKGKFSLDGVNYKAVVKKIYPEVTNNVFHVDMAFLGEQPKDIKRGQVITIDLIFSKAQKRLMVAKGGFYQQTGGRWIYLISKDGKSAHRQDIRLGRQNPRYVEVLEGLKEGDWVVTSGYDAFREADELIFDEPIKLKE